METLDDGSEPGESVRTLSTLSTATEVVESILRSNGATVSDLAEELDTAESTLYNYISTLREHGWLVRDGPTYHLSLKFFRLGAFTRTANTIYHTARPEVDQLADQTGEMAHLSAEQNGSQIHLHKAQGKEAVGSEYHRTKLHESSHLHDTATGKAILAALPRERVEEILVEHGLPRKTPQTITDRESLFEELETIERRGYAVNDEEEIEGLRAVGASIRDRSGSVRGSISVSGPTSRLRGERFHTELPELVVERANVIEVNINMENRLSQSEGQSKDG